MFNAYETIALVTRAPSGKLDPLVTVLALLSPVIFIIIYRFYNKNVETRWEKGIFPSNFAYTRDNLMEAYICLTGVILRADRNDTKEKMSYLQNYFRKHFPEENYQYMDSLKFSYEHPIQLKTISSWMRKKLSSRQRLQVMYFLAGLAYVDGFMNARERKVFVELKELLEISEKDYRSILGMHEQRREREENHQRKKKEPSAYRKKSNIKLSCEVLGIAESASMDEIKKAYRTLVKLHHPDRYATESVAQQKIAEERFLEIQKAYETLEKYK
ncbi:MAG: DnaJ domain-containing protein [Crocinitomicaceae bacterium]|nr:DnaJ domain-containing protein [Crocinitomicaceae bacterium]